MTIDKFTREQFENYLSERHSPWAFTGIKQGECTYSLPLDEKVSISIRSSVRPNGNSADTGKDSIRCWMVDKNSNPIAKKMSRTNRQSGWQDRLFGRIQILAQWRELSGDCPDCQKPKSILLSETKKNNGRMFAKCQRCDSHFQWLDEFAKEDLKKTQFEKTNSKPEVETAEEKLKPSLEDFLAEINEMEILEVPEYGPNEKQLEAIEMPVNANVRMLAGPGTGKTFTVSYRYQFLVNNGINPDNILVLTYSKPMADEAGKRISTLVPSANIGQISTIHAFDYRELTRNNPELKYFGWQVPDKHSNVKPWQIKQKLEDLISKYYQGGIDEKPAYKEVLSWIDNSKYHGIKPENCAVWFTSQLGAYFGILLGNIRVEFDQWLYSQKNMTFSDMLYLMEQELINNPEFKSKMQAKYSHVIVDEAQDTNYQAFRILYHLGNANLFLVGDTNQTMYRFQGAEPSLIISEIDTVLPNIQTIILEKNYRSEDQIIDAFQSLIGYNYEDQNGPYEQKYFQNIQGTKGDNGSIAFSMSDDIFKESRSIAEEITTLTGENGGYNPGDIFVGARTKAQLGYLEGELLKQGIKFINIAGGSFWDNHHVKNVVDYLRLANDTSDKKALKQVANIASNENCYTWSDKKGKFQAGDYCPVRYLGQKFLEKIDHNFENIDKFLLSANDSWRYKTNDKVYHKFGPTKAQDLQEFIWSLQSAALEAENVGQIIQVILDDCYEKYLKVTEGVADEDESNILDNLRTVIEVASRYNNVEDFLGYVNEMALAAQDMKDKNWNDYVVISTYHRLKGLEREVIFGMGWCEGYNDFDEPIGLLPHTFSLRPPPQFGVLPGGAQSPVEDERCIGFVCISRAKDRVYLSGCREYRKSTMYPSRFIKEIFGE